MQQNFRQFLEFPANFLIFLSEIGEYLFYCKFSNWCGLSFFLTSTFSTNFWIISQSVQAWPGPACRNPNMFVVSAVAITIHEDPLISPPASRKTSDASNIYFFFYFNLFLKQENVVLNFWQGCQHQSRKSMRTGQYTDTKYFFQRFLHSLVPKSFLWKHFQTTV